MSERLLPPNATAFEFELERQSFRLETLPTATVRTMYNAATIPAQALPWLAWAWNVETWSAGWTEEAKRAAVRDSISIKRVKGTAGAVRQALQALYGAAQVVEGTSGPFTFSVRVAVTAEPLDLATLQGLQRVALGSKNLRSHLDSITLEATARGELVVACAIQVGTCLELGAWPLRLRGIAPLEAPRPASTGWHADGRPTGVNNNNVPR